MKVADKQALKGTYCRGQATAAGTGRHKTGAGCMTVEHLNIRNPEIHESECTKV